MEKKLKQERNLNKIKIIQKNELQIIREKFINIYSICGNKSRFLKEIRKMNK